MPFVNTLYVTPNTNWVSTREVPYNDHDAKKLMTNACWLSEQRPASGTFLPSRAFALPASSFFVG